MGHVVLLGDSIFDNARYVPDQPPVIEQLRRFLPANWSATLLAVDGHTTLEVPGQLKKLPADATHLVVSAGGNDALGEISILAEPAGTVGQAMSIMQEIRANFENSYQAALQALRQTGKAVAVCTVYDAIPGLGPAERIPLAGFNDVILRQAFQAGLPVLDLRLVCDRPSDYSHVSAIEPSMAGGLKIARLIAEVVTQHNFDQGRSIVYH